MSADAQEAWKYMLTLMIAGEGRDRLHRVCDEYDLTPAALKALLLLSAGPQPMRDLAETFRWNPSFLTGVVDVLEQMGAATREPHPRDRRVKTVTLTDSGRALLRQVQNALWEPPSAFEALTEPEQRVLRDLLARIAERDTELWTILQAV